MILSRRMIAIVVASVAAISSSALAADASSDSAGCPAPNAKDAPVAYIKNPKWLRQPSGDDVTNAYPPLAYKGHKSDRTLVDCSITDDGLLKDCSVVDDKRPGKGFDKATLGLTKLYKMPPLAEQPAYTGMPECIRKLGAPHVLLPMDWFAGG